MSGVSDLLISPSTNACAVRMISLFGRIFLCESRRDGGERQARADVETKNRI